MGGIFGSKTKTVREPFESNPWTPQQPFLISGFESAQDALTGALGGVRQIGDMTADLTQPQLDAVSGLVRTGTQTTAPVASTAIGTGLDALRGYEGFRGNAQDIFNLASEDPTQRILGNAAAYADDPYLQGQIDSVLKDVNTAFRREVGNINSAATGTGNINSTRAGALEALALDDAQDRAASISSQMRGAAYQAGIDRAMDTEARRLGGMLDANQVLGSSSAAGLDMAIRGLGAQSDGYNLALGAGGVLQGQEQAEIDGRVAQTALPLDLVSQYMAAISGNYGSNGFQTRTYQQPGLGQMLLGGLSTLGGLGWKPFG